MAGVKGRSGRICNEEMRQAKVRAGRKGAHNRWVLAKTATSTLPQEKLAEFQADATRLGLEVPDNISDALKLKQLLVTEERQKKIQADREYAEGFRIPIELVDNYVERMVFLFTKFLDTMPRLFDDCPEFTEDQLIILRRRVREKTEAIRESFSKEEVYERDHRSEPTQSGVPEQHLVEAPEEVPIEED